MTPFEHISIDEVATLLEQLAARDQRTTSPVDITTWWHDLNTGRVNYGDAQAAANYYYAVVWPAQKDTDRYRLTAPKVIELVKKVREDRLEGFVYQPDPNETGAEYVTHLKQQHAAVAAGIRPAALEHELTPRPVKELVAGVAAARVLPPEIADVIARRRPPGTEVHCPVCGARPKQKCRAVTGRGGIRELSTIHPTRIKAATEGNPA